MAEKNGFVLEAMPGIFVSKIKLALAAILVVILIVIVIVLAAVLGSHMAKSDEGIDLTTYS